ncbi:protein FAM98B [Hetaerina americana]|uniref:protein FAM98B n=1 Tax=Hetaerina americana TaxID=62018 RepID=UPI003A7F2948
MENDILDALEDIGYTGPMLEDGALEKAVEGGPKSIEYTELVSWLSNELKTLCKLEEHINAITSPEDSSSFVMEVSSFLKELGCPHKSLTEGHLSERLTTKVSRILFLEFLVCELEAARMIKVKKPNDEKGMQVELKESSTASDLKAMLIALKFPKPPSNITSSMLFGKMEQKVKEVVDKAPAGLVGKPLFFGTLSDKQWHTLMGIQQELHEEYRMRREMLIKRLDVTIQSFLWSERAKSQEDRIAQIFQSKRARLRVEPTVELSHLLAAREDLAILEKTSCASVRKNTQSQINKVIIGKVPDRGGRPSEQQPPPPEMPSWQQRPSDGGRGGGRGGGGGGGGGRVQGGWSQGGRGGGQGGGGGAGGYQGGGGHQGGGGGYQGGGGSGYQGGGGGGGGGYQGGGGGGGGGYQGGGGGYQGGGGGGGGYQGGGGGYQGGDVIGLFLYVLPAKTLCFRRQQHHRGVLRKQRLAVLLSITNADGSGGYQGGGRGGGRGGGGYRGGGDGGRGNRGGRGGRDRDRSYQQRNY